MYVRIGAGTARRVVGERSEATHIGAALGLVRMEPTLLHPVLLPPPATGASVFPGEHRAGARRASDGGEALIVQPIVGNLVVAEVGPDLVLIPIGQGIELDDPAVIFVHFDFFDRGAVRGLLPPCRRLPQSSPTVSARSTRGPWPPST